MSLKLPNITPGPWNVAPWSKEFDCYGGPGKCGVDSPTVAVAITNGLPDARAIAAVPALLEALAEMDRYFAYSHQGEVDPENPCTCGDESFWSQVRAALLLAGATEEK